MNNILNNSEKMTKQTEKTQNSDLVNIEVPCPTHEEIATLAYHIWQSEGCPDGCAERHWYEAEAQIIRTRQAEALEKIKERQKAKSCSNSNVSATTSSATKATVVCSTVCSETKPQQPQKEAPKVVEKKPVVSGKRPGKNKNRGQSSQSW